MCDFGLHKNSSETYDKLSVSAMIEKDARRFQLELAKIPEHLINM